METILRKYSDSMGNTIISSQEFPAVKVIFNGKNNTLKLSNSTYISKGTISFTGNNAKVELGKNSKNKPHILNIRIGEDSFIKFGDAVTIEKNASFFASEGVQILVGDDCMIASNVQFRADDSHPIFSVSTGNRINKSRNIEIGNHCWLGFGCTILKGTKLLDGSVVGMNSIVTSSFPNNVLITGIPARIVKRDIAWERPNLATTLPPYKNHISCIKKSEKYWNLTKDIASDENIRKNPKLVIDYLSVKKSKSSQDWYNLGLAYFVLKDFAKSSESFISSLNSCGIESQKFRIYKAIGNSFFRSQKFNNAIKYFEEARLLNPFDIDTSISSIISYCKLGHVSNCFKTVMESKELLSQDRFLAFLAKLYDYVSLSKDEKLKEVFSNVLYDIQYKAPNSNNQMNHSNNECYIFVQPLLEKPHLFFNKKFNCSTIYIKQNFAYLYFVPLFGQILKKVSNIINGCKLNKITILSTSAGAYFSINLGSYLAKQFPEINFNVQAFAPQIAVTNNDNLKNVTHYKVFNRFLAKSKELKKHDIKYTDVSSLLNESGNNIHYDLYYGEKAEVDVREISRINTLKTNIKLTVIPNFPFHSVLPLYRFDEQRLRKMYDSFVPLVPESGKQPEIKYSIEELLVLKKREKYDLKLILPHMKD